MQCAKHPNTETELACGKCETPICPKCLHYTPVGTRCRECANLKRLPQYNISFVYLARGFGAAVVAGAILGTIWGVVIPFSFSFFFGLIVGLGLGYGVGEAVSQATNRKVGLPLQVLAAGGVVVAYLVRSAILASAFRGVDVVNILTNDMLGYIVVGLGAFIAVGRLR